MMNTLTRDDRKKIYVKLKYDIKDVCIENSRVDDCCIHALSLIYKNDMTKIKHAIK